MVTTLAAQYGQVALITIAVIGVVVITTLVLQRRRRDVWQEFARSRGLSYTTRGDAPRVIGDIQGRSVEVSVDDASSDRDIGGVEVVHLCPSICRESRQA